MKGSIIRSEFCPVQQQDCVAQNFLLECALPSPLLLLLMMTPLNPHTNHSGDAESVTNQDIPSVPAQKSRHYRLLLPLSPYYKTTNSCLFCLVIRPLYVYELH